MTWLNALTRRVGGFSSNPLGDDAKVWEAFSEESPRPDQSQIIDALTDDRSPVPPDPVDWWQGQQPQSVQDAGIGMLWDQSDSERDIDRGRWDDLRMGGSVKLSGASDPTLKVFRGGLRAWAFIDGATVKEVFLQGQLPHSYLEGSDLKLHIHWGHISAADNGAVVWQAEWDWTNIGGAMAAPTTSAASAANVLAAEQYFQKITQIVTMPGTGKKISSILTIRLFRDPTRAGDTSTADAFLFEVDAHYQLDRAGSKGESTKN